jgi:hypothetical protein
MCNTRPLARVDIRTGLREVFTDRLGSVELKTHVLKAIAKNPGERYATAGELADDLRRWLEDRPIRADHPREVPAMLFPTLVVGGRES